MKILVASDSFKGTISSRRIGEIIAEELSEFHKVDFVPVSDGGEGFIDAVKDYFDGSLRKVRVKDPLGRNIPATYLLAKDKKSAVIESSAACGLPLLADGEKNPMKTSTYGAGQLVTDAIEQGAEMIYFGLGGSTTNDGGTGLLEALGVKFLNREGSPLTGLKGEMLSEIASLETSDFDNRTNKIRIIIVSDVNNPLLGDEGATYTYGPQKGADHDILVSLERGMKQYADVVNQHIMGDNTEVPGAGAAGGLGYCLKSFFDAEIRRGIDTVMELSCFSQKLINAELVITGEGKIDKQTPGGKVIQGVTEKAVNHNIPVIAVCGINQIGTIPGVKKIFSVVPAHASLNDSVENPEFFFRKMVCSKLIQWINNKVA